MTDKPCPSRRAFCGGFFAALAYGTICTPAQAGLPDFSKIGQELLADPHPQALKNLHSWLTKNNSSPMQLYTVIRTNLSNASNRFSIPASPSQALLALKACCADYGYLPMLQKVAQFNPSLLTKQQEHILIQYQTDPSIVDKSAPEPPNISADMASLFEALMRKFGHRCNNTIHVNSFYRSKEHQALLVDMGYTDAEEGPHTRALAIDFSIPGVPLGEVYTFIRQELKLAAGLYGKNNGLFVHVDLQDPSRTWAKTDGDPTLTAIYHRVNGTRATSSTSPTAPTSSQPRSKPSDDDWKDRVFGKGL